jgi:hypothetical protein
MDRDPRLYHLSPLRVIDPSRGPQDERLEASLRADLMAGSTADEQASGSGYEGEIFVGHLTEDELIRRLRAVGGWDILAVYRGYQHGMASSKLQQIRGRWLRRRLATHVGPQQDGYRGLVIVRDEAVVGQLLLHGCDLPDGLVGRVP